MLIALIVMIVVALTEGVVLCAVLLTLHRKKLAEAEIGTAEERVKKIIDEGQQKAESLKKEALLEAKEDILRQRNDAERELKDRRAEVTRMERRVTQKEENLDKKSEQLERKNEQLDKKLAENDAVRAEIEEVLQKHVQQLEEISGMTAQQAKEELIGRVESEVKHDLAQRLDELEEQFKEEADTKAKNILSLAIQRCAADHVAEATISVVPLPSDDMKGRIIGREGRNIQKL